MVITFSRRYGTGASAIAKAISEKYSLPIYGKEYFNNKCKGLSGTEYISAQKRIIQSLSKTPCIIMGRGASIALKGNDDVINVYVMANKQDRIKRVMEKENITKEEAETRIKFVDSERIAFFEKSTGELWGNLDNYNVVIDVSKIGIEKSISLLERYIDRM